MAAVVGAALLVSQIFAGARAAFSPADNYLIDCGSTTSTNKADITSSWTLSAPNSVTVSVAANAVASLNTPALYQTTRILTSTSSYSIPIKNQGRHFHCLALFPFSHQRNNLTAATFSIYNDFKEYLLNIARDTLLLTFDPSVGSSLAFVNAGANPGSELGLHQPLNLGPQLRCLHERNLRSGGEKEIVVPVNEVLVR